MEFHAILAVKPFSILIDSILNIPIVKISINFTRGEKLVLLKAISQNLESLDFIDPYKRTKITPRDIKGNCSANNHKTAIADLVTHKVFLSGINCWED